MATPQVTLSNSYGGFVCQEDAQGEFVFDGSDLQQVDELTAAVDTIIVPEEAIHEYRSIVSLKGMFANSPLWEDLPEYLEQYWREIEETVETD